jgi:hypothetical protein
MPLVAAAAPRPASATDVSDRHFVLAAAGFRLRPRGMMRERETIFARISTASPRDIIGFALAQLDARPDRGSLSERAEHILAELQRHGYRIKRR